MKRLYTVEYRSFFDRTKTETKTVTIHANHITHYVFENQETGRKLMIAKNRIINMRAAGLVETAA